MSAQFPDTNVLYSTEVYHPSKSNGFWQCKFSTYISDECSASVFGIVDLTSESYTVVS
jgi:hypothetical protein